MKEQRLLNIYNLNSRTRLTITNTNSATTEQPITREKLSRRWFRSFTNTPDNPVDVDSMTSDSEKITMNTMERNSVAQKGKWKKLVFESRVFFQKQLWLCINVIIKNWCGVSITNVIMHSCSFHSCLQHVSIFGLF